MSNKLSNKSWASGPDNCSAKVYVGAFFGSLLPSVLALGHECMHEKYANLWLCVAVPEVYTGKVLLGVLGI